MVFGWITAAGSPLPHKRARSLRPRRCTGPRRYGRCPGAAYTDGSGRCRRRWCRGSCAVEQHPCGRADCPAVIAAGQGQLAVQGFGARRGCPWRRPHRRCCSGVVPEQQVAVQIPVVVVGCAAVVGLAGAQRAADLHQEHRVVLLHKGVLPFLGGQVGVQILQLLGGDEGDLPARSGNPVQGGERAVQGRCRCRRWRPRCPAPSPSDSPSFRSSRIDDASPSPTGPRRWSGGCPSPHPGGWRSYRCTGRCPRGNHSA